MTGVNHASNPGQVPRSESGDFRSHGGYPSGNLVAWNHGKGGASPFIPNLMDVGVADARIENLDHDIPRTRIPTRELIGDKGGFWSLGGKTECFDHE
jgi:hypothetical protein